MTRRNTIQKQLVLNAVKELMCHPTADKVYNEIVTLYPGISKATVYRNLNHLSEDGHLKKINVPGSADKYDAKLEDHYHAMCKYCDNFIDIKIDKPVEIDFNNKVMEENMVDGYVILFEGVCPDCRKKMKNVNKK